MYDVENDQRDPLGEKQKNEFGALEAKYNLLNKTHTNVVQEMYKLQNKHRALTLLFSLEEIKHTTAEAKIEEIYAGRSWRITKPLRILSFQYKMIKSEGMSTRLIKIPKKIIMLIKKQMRKHGMLTKQRLEEQLSLLSPVELKMYRVLKTNERVDLPGPGLKNKIKEEI